MRVREHVSGGMNETVCLTTCCSWLPRSKFELCTYAIHILHGNLASAVVKRCFADGVHYWLQHIHVERSDN
eukprot:m.83937 g.83937  ORF g.83937 m.83937 type:complete len:71 (+) comp12733_c0_seq2:1691-1903(+)